MYLWCLSCCLLDFDIVLCLVLVICVFTLQYMVCGLVCLLFGLIVLFDVLNFVFCG